ncbi:MAG: STAS domain-containing protein [Planctomycetota bacterium]
MADHLRVRSIAWGKVIAFVRLAGELTHLTIPQFDRELRGWLEQGVHSFVFDLGHLTTLSNTGGGALISGMRVAQDRGGRVTLVNPSPAARETLERLALLPFLHIVTSEAEAREFHRVDAAVGKLRMSDSLP